MLVVYVLRIGLPRRITMMLQERGRCSHAPGVLGLFVMFVEWTLFIFVLITVVLPLESSTSDELPDYAYAGSMIEACTPERRAAAVESNKHTHTQRAPLSAAQRHNNIVDEYNDLIDMLHFTFLPGYGCIHLRLEWYLFNGYLTSLPEVLLQESC